MQADKGEQFTLHIGQDMAILELSSALMQRACKAAPGSPQYAVEAGYQALLQGDVQAALAHYSQASHLHELDMDAMYGSIECDLLNSKVGMLVLQLLCCLGPASSVPSQPTQQLCAISKNHGA